jgi:type 1 glutamine amidotransferase
MKLIAFVVIMTMLNAISANAQTQSVAPIKALLITGHNNHNWPLTSRLHADTLEATGRFLVDITDTPATTLADAVAMAKYQLFLIDYNDSHEPKRWSEAAEKNFIEAVRNGAGVVAIHSANNAFKGWIEYEQMLGLMWREGTGHGTFHRFTVTFFNRGHPISRGYPDMIGHPDELYHHLVNAQGVDYTVLGEAESMRDTGGSGQTEPVAIVLNFGKGRIFATALGHVWTNVEQTKQSACDPAFKALLCRGAEWAATGSVTLPEKWADVVNHNTLSEAEKAEGWTLLFDGTSTNGWRGFKSDSFPANGWSVREGALVVERGAPGNGGGDIITVDEYGDFEFVCEWKVASGGGGNSGIIYRSTEDHDYSWQTGLEMQILDNAGHADGRDPKTSAGALYALVPRAAELDVVRPAGEWNHARIVARGTKIEHHLNGFKILEIDLASEKYASLRAESKWAKHPDMGTRTRGHIALQDHGDQVEFRALKVRRLD